MVDSLRRSACVGHPGALGLFAVGAVDTSLSDFPADGTAYGYLGLIMRSRRYCIFYFYFYKPHAKASRTIEYQN